VLSTKRLRSLAHAILRPRVASPAFLRVCGVGAVLAGVLFATWGYLDGGNDAYLVGAATTALSVLVPALFVLGVAGLHARCEGLVGQFGNTGFIITFIGLAAGIVHGLESLISWYETYVMGYAHATMSGQLLPGLYAWLAWTLVGLSVVGIANVWTKTLGILRALPLAMAALGWAFYVTDTGGVVEVRLNHIGFGVLFSLSWVLLGGVLWRQG
jgi:hypothetical protein